MKSSIFNFGCHFKFLYECLSWVNVISGEVEASFGVFVYCSGRSLSESNIVEVIVKYFNVRKLLSKDERKDWIMRKFLEIKVMTCV